MPAGSYALLAPLDVRIDAVHLHRLTVRWSANRERTTTLVILEGRGHVGVGEDVTWEPRDHDRFAAQGPLDLRGTSDLGRLAARLDAAELFAAPPLRPASQHYRRWAYESAALDLALRQAGVPLHAVLGRTPAAVRFVRSMGLPTPPTLAPLRDALRHDAAIRFKLDPTPHWSRTFLAELAALARVDVLDLKGLYRGTPVDQRADHRLYRDVLAAFPNALLEDADLDPRVRPLFAGRERDLTWDAPLHGPADLRRLPFPPRVVNFKPSRFGSLERLLDAYDHCRAHRIAIFGGGQLELGPGRGQVQYLASLFHADAPNDVAPVGYNLPGPVAHLPRTPLAPVRPRSGFRGDDRSSLWRG
ncbi:MAG: hypothetical protein IPM29_13395 [Planctomycetes bacterium]|nr:hypothetical protein [Planctomycetota bacterium]